MLEDRELSCYPDGTPIETLEAPVEFIGIRKSGRDDRIFLTTITDTSLLPHPPDDDIEITDWDEDKEERLYPSDYMRIIDLPFYIKDKGINFGVFLKKWEKLCELCTLVKEVPTAETCPNMPRFLGFRWLAWFKLPPFLKVSIIAPDFNAEYPLLSLTDYDQKMTYSLFIDPAYKNGANFVPDILP